jgi:chromosome segregation ATPase
MRVARTHARRVGAEQPEQAPSSDGELRQLRASVAAMREELDRQRVGEDTRVQHALSGAQQEIDGLRRGIQALRHELDAARINAETRLQQGASASIQEIEGLRRGIQTVRDELDLALQRGREERDRLERDWRGQLEEARATIVELRAQLERRA